MRPLPGLLGSLTAQQWPRRARVPGEPRGQAGTLVASPLQSPSIPLRGLVSEGGGAGLPDSTGGHRSLGGWWRWSASQSGRGMGEGSTLKAVSGQCDLPCGCASRGHFRRCRTPGIHVSANASSSCPLLSSRGTFRNLTLGTI